MDIIHLISQNGTVAFVAFLLAFAVPYLIVYALHELRFRRLRLLKDYEASFSTIDADKPGEKKPDFVNNPSFEFVRSKYVSDIDDVEFGRLTADAPEITLPATGGKHDELGRKIDILLFKRPGFFALKTNWRLLLMATGFGILTFFGFFFAFASFRSGAALPCGPDGTGCVRVFFTGGSSLSPENLGRFEEQLRTVMALTFIGGYVSAIREFLRRMSVFDLTGYAFLKQATEIFASVVFVAFLFRAFPHPGDMLGQVFSDPPSGTGSNQPAIPGLSWGWIAIAPLFGLFPESASRYLFIRAGAFMNWIKSEDNRFNGLTRSVPIDVIDGVDFWTRIRLEQSGIFDVQNLATFNPIMLYIETPFGFYEVFDWIAQAQLCHIIGIEKFLLFREINIRTIFDLERAVRSKQAPEQFDEIAAAILFATTSTMSGVEVISKLSPIIKGDDGKMKAGTVADFSIWARSRLGESTDVNTKAMEHLANWISDDLHVRRLRRLWKDISASLGPDALHLDDDKDAPPPPPPPAPNPPEPQPL